MTKYKSITLQKSLLDMVDKLVQDPKVGYKSRSEFVHDAIRRRIEGLLVLHSDLGDLFVTEKKETEIFPGITITEEKED